MNGWSVGDFITHRVRGPGIVELVQRDRIRVKWGQNGVQTWVSTRSAVTR